MKIAFDISFANIYLRIDVVDVICVCLLSCGLSSLSRRPQPSHSAKPLRDLPSILPKWILQLYIMCCTMHSKNMVFEIELFLFVTNKCAHCHCLEQIVILSFPEPHIYIPHWTQCIFLSATKESSDCSRDCVLKYIAHVWVCVYMSIWFSICFIIH